MWKRKARLGKAGDDVERKSPTIVLGRRWKVCVLRDVGIEG